MALLRENLKHWLRAFPHVDRLVRLALRRVRARTTAYPRWSTLLGADYEEYRAGAEAAHGGPNILIATSVGGYVAGVALESLIGAALALRGAQPHVLLCDRVLPACLHCDTTWYPDQRRFVRDGPRGDLCHDCFAPAARVYGNLGCMVHAYSAYLTPAQREHAAALAASVPAREIGDFRSDGIAVGEHALAGALRFYARATLDGEPHGEAVLRRYLHAALLTVQCTRSLLSRHHFEAAVFHHGIYVPQGLIGEVCRQMGVRVVNWSPAYRKRCFIFSHDDTYHHTLLSEPVASWENVVPSPDHEEALLQYLKSRWQGTEDWIWFHERPVEDIDEIARTVGVRFDRPCVGLLTNVMWDAQLHYPANAFANMLDWVVETIRYFQRRPDLQLLIRVHPAEIRGTLFSRQPLAAELRRVFPTLPSNVFVIPPESRVSTYAAMARCNAVLIYGTKTGVELTSMGIPVIVAGEAWIRNKGLTLDATSPAHYYALLDRLPLPEPMDDAMRRRARQYAFHFFFRRMIPLEHVTPTKGNPPYSIGLSGLSGLLPGASVGLDVICDGILRGTPFVYPAERLPPVVQSG